MFFYLYIYIHTFLSVWIGKSHRCFTLLFSTTFWGVSHLDLGGSSPYLEQMFLYTMPAICCLCVCVCIYIYIYARYCSIIALYLIRLLLYGFVQSAKIYIFTHISHIYVFFISWFLYSDMRAFPRNINKWRPLCWGLGYPCHHPALHMPSPSIRVKV